ncbi:MAG: DUF262 domain-containing HNH endonuclease family protein [Chloroherpetonaceae bacterium]
MATTFLNTKSMSYGELIGNGVTYTVPPYQRDYAWEEEFWDDLWQDILEIPREKYHYTGYVVLQESEKKKFSIIDGQQRLTTIAIISLACIKLLDEWIQNGIDAESNKQRKEKLIERFIGNRPASSLKLSSKLRLNKNSDGFFQSYLIDQREPRNKSKLKPTEKLLWSAFEYFCKKVREKFQASQSGEAVAFFLEETLAEGLLFTTIYVDDDINAYKVFETLNARGVKLSTADLLKNYIFSLAASGGNSDFEHAEQQWQKINETLRDNELPAFLRYYWASRYPIETKKNLFKAIKKQIDTAEKSFELLNRLEETVDLFVALGNQNDEFWNSWNSEATSHIAALSLFRVTQCFPLLIAGYEKLSKDEFVKLLRVIEVVSFRYNVIGGLNPNIAEGLYNKAAIKTTEGILQTAKAVFQEIKPLYTSDEKFKSDFSLKTISPKSGKNLLKYILLKLESHVSGKDYGASDSATIEHILPENPSERWLDAFDETARESYTNRLGNFTLLEESKNKEAGTKEFDEKKKIYRQSQYELSSKIEVLEWNPDAIKTRQTQMAKWATAIWRLDFSD